LTINSIHSTPNKKKGFTLIELVVVIAIIVIIVSAGFTIRVGVLPDAILSTQTRQVLEGLKLAQIKSISRYKNSEWGVYFLDNTGSPDQWIIFKGSTYTSRDTAYDQITTLPSSLSFTSISFNGTSELKFAQITGTPSTSGSLTLTSTENEAQTITVSARGVVDVN
jgi:prepilin-type N-terminal cleavage/methylation domain-containing protein